MKKIEWINLMKGIGIITVVCGHVLEGLPFRLIYLFHMPLFFFISGFLFNPKTNYKQYFKSKIIHLIIPYFAFLVPLYFYFNPMVSLDSTWNEIAIYFARPLIGGIKLSGALTAFWFITCLFIVQQLMNLIFLKFEKRTINILMIGSLLLSYLNSFYFPNFWLPLSANIVLAALPIFYIGYLFKTKEYQINEGLLFALGILTIVFTYFFPVNKYDMKNAIYGIPIITLASSIIITLLIKLLSSKLSQINVVSKPLSELGNASLVIMFLHQPLQILINNYVTSDKTIRITFAIIISYWIYLILNKFYWSRAVFLGSKVDFNRMLNRVEK